jgi:N6-L-threonylcarbamoyladenine synthase
MRGKLHWKLKLILGIESSCDETAAAVVAEGRRVVSSVVASQFDTHGKYGGVVPELASREHLRAIVPVVREAMQKASIGYGDLAAVAATQGPGLVGSLLVGITQAKAISVVHGLPLIGVNHIEGHIHAVLMESGDLPMPALALIVSGGHTHLFEIREGFHYRLLGKTRDDAAGEAYDKVAKLLGFSYPGGPILDKLAPYGNANLPSPFTSPKMKGNELDFSFSGMKTAALRWVESREMRQEIEARRALRRAVANPSVEQWLEVTPQATRDLVASFQAAVIHELLHKAKASADRIGARCVIVSGGVACNVGLRAAATSQLRVPAYFPTPVLSTDNAAMIAAAAWRKYEARDFAGLSLTARSSMPLA